MTSLFRSAKRRYSCEPPKVVRAQARKLSESALQSPITAATSENMLIRADVAVNPNA